MLNLEDTTDTASVSQNADSDTESVRQVIKYIQKEAKVYRTGIKYTALLQYSMGNFKRPKCGQVPECAHMNGIWLTGF